MSIATDDPFVELYWVKKSGELHAAWFPESIARLMLNKHLLPQQDAGIIRNVGINRIN